MKMLITCSYKSLTSELCVLNSKKDIVDWALICLCFVYQMNHESNVHEHNIVLLYIHWLMTKYTHLNEHENVCLRKTTNSHVNEIQESKLKCKTKGETPWNPTQLTQTSTEYSANCILNLFITFT